MAHPVEKVKELEAEAERGRSERTPLIALTGVTVAIGIVVAIVVAVGLVLYSAYGGKELRRRVGEAARERAVAAELPRERLVAHLQLFRDELASGLVVA